MKVAVLIPCYNEELTIAKVIDDFKIELKDADIYVYDNNSTDKTAEIAISKGAIVKKEPCQGKGNVVRSMFQDIEADIYVMVDGDDTYPAESVNLMIDKIKDGSDMVIGDRLSNGTYASENKRGFHNLGNNLVKLLINKMFSSNLKDIMTGYRAFSKKFVKTISIMSPGFQIETELTITALVHRYRIDTVDINYRDRIAENPSKLNTFRDGFKVLVTLFNLCKDYRPLLFFGLIALILAIIALLIGIPVILEFIRYHFIFKIPSAILASAIFVIAFLFIILGLILDHNCNIEKRNHELYVNRWLYEEKKKD